MERKDRPPLGSRGILDQACCRLRRTGEAETAGLPWRPGRLGGPGRGAVSGHRLGWRSCSGITGDAGGCRKQTMPCGVSRAVLRCLASGRWLAGADHRPYRPYTIYGAYCQSRWFVIQGGRKVYFVHGWSVWRFSSFSGVAGRARRPIAMQASSRPCWPAAISRCCSWCPSRRRTRPRGRFSPTPA